MTADAVILQVYPGSQPTLAFHVVQFVATDDPRSGQITAEIDITQTQDQIKQAVKQALADFINAQRGQIVIAAADVRLP